MRLAIFGATGGTGREIMAQALDAGHDVVVVVRRPQAINVRNERLTVIHGDVLEPSTLAPRMGGLDAVVSALGIGVSRADTTVYSVGTANVLRIMRDMGVRRFICVSSAALDVPPVTTAPLRWFLFGLILHSLFKRPYADMARMEAQIGLSESQWTIIRPTRLTNGPRTGNYRVKLNQRLPSAWSISRADLAHYIIEHLDDKTTYHTTVELAY